MSLEASYADDASAMWISTVVMRCDVRGNSVDKARTLYTRTFTMMLSTYSRQNDGSAEDGRPSLNDLVNMSIHDSQFTSGT